MSNIETLTTSMKSKSNLILFPENVRIYLISFFLVFLFFNQANLSVAQEPGKADKIYHFSGIITATNNGISVIPSFSLGKPALMFELSVGGEKLSFDPQMRFSMQGKPWSFVFWWRYHLYESEKFRMRIGAHPAFLFADISYQKEGRSIESVEARRYLAGEIAPTFQVSKKVAIKPYLLAGHGFDEGVHNSLYLTMITSFSDIGVTDHIRFAVVPQVFFLKMDHDHGYYFASSFNLSHNKLPLSLSSMFNYKIDSQIASKDFIWNVSLVYTFDKNFKRL